MSTGFPHLHQVMLEPETYTGGIVETNGHLLHLPDCTLLIDAPQGISAWLKAKNVHVDALFLTHQHFDHVLDAASVKEQYGCPIYAWSAFNRELTLEKFFGAMTGSAFSVPEYKVDFLFEGTEKVIWGDHSWDLFHVPGHSPDSTVCYLKEEELMFSGDVIFRGSIGRTDFPGGSTKQLVTGIQEKLWPLGEETRVYSGHGPSTTLGREHRENPFL
jgi:hydroxyacylglutathione hydrolase